MVKLGSVASLERVQHDGSALPYVGLEDIEEKSGRLTASPVPRQVQSSTFRFDSSHVLYGRLRPYLNKWAVPAYVGHCSTEIIPLRPGSDLMREYLGYWLSSPEINRRIVETSRGSRMPRGNMDELLEFPIPLPPLSKQKEIVATLDQALAEVAAASVLGEEQLRSQASLTEAVRYAAFSLPETPRRSLGDIIEVIIDHRGKTPKKLGGDFTESGVRVISAIHVKAGRIHWERRDRFVSQELYEKWMPVPVRRGDVLLTSEAPLGEVAQVPDDEPLVLSQRLYGLRGAPNVVTNDFLFHFLRSPEGQRELSARQTGATAVGIKQSELMKISVPVPPLEVQGKICASLNAFDQESSELRYLSSRRLNLLSELRSAYLRALLNGEQ